LFLPYDEYEDLLRFSTIASDGQYKVQIFLNTVEHEIYIPKVGRFNVEGHIGWAAFDCLSPMSDKDAIPDYSHQYIQSLLVAIGTIKNMNVWVPTADRSTLSREITETAALTDSLPHGFSMIEPIMSEIDVIWLDPHSKSPRSLFEVEHSTPIYSGLLRFNDVLLSAPNISMTYSIVSNYERRSTFAKQLRRPTFLASKLSEICSFLNYSDVYHWHCRLSASNLKDSNHEASR